LSSLIVGSLPSCSSKTSKSALQFLIGLGDFFWVVDDLFFEADARSCNWPNSITKFPNSCILKASWSRTEPIMELSGLLSSSLRSCIISSRRPRFSVRRRDTSASRQRMRICWVELFLRGKTDVRISLGYTVSVAYKMVFLLCEFAILSSKSTLDYFQESTVSQMLPMIKDQGSLGKNLGACIRASTDSVATGGSFRRAI
jgi:hypothetical protein